MQDLTTGSITRHLLKTTSFMLVMMVFQTLYFLVDLYWVGRLGTAAIAGVAIAGNLTFIVLALGQMLGVGTTTVVSHAAGRRAQAEAQHLFHQSLVLAVATGALFLVLGLALHGGYARAMAADSATPTACPVPPPKSSTGASSMLTTTLTVETSMGCLNCPVARSAAPITPSGNCSAIAGMNQRR